MVELDSHADASFIDESPALMATLDGGGRLRWANASWQRELGWSQEELHGRAFDALVHPDDLDALAQMRAGASSAAQTAHHRARLRHRDGSWRWIDWFVAAFARGRFYGREWESVLAAGDRIEREVQLLALAEEVAGVGHWTVDVATGETHWSPQIYRIYGLDPSGPPPDLDAAIAQYHPDDRNRVVQLVERAVAEGAAFAFELRLVRADGAVRHVVSRGRCTVDPATGRTLTLFGTFLDVTERDLEREQLARERRLVTVGTLAAGVGHELNNPLTYVTANLDEVIEEMQRLAGPTQDGAQRAMLDRLTEARVGVDRLSRIVRGLRAFAREDGPSKPTDLRAAIDLSVDMAAHEIRHRATCEVAHGDVPPVEGDDSRVAQVLVNLLANAAQAFASSDPERNRIEVRSRRDGEGHVAVTVTDNGPGIAPEALPRIFDPFFTTKPVGRGTGLGLAISRAVVHSIGGELSCASTPGLGTTFTLRLRAARSADVARPPEAAAGTASMRLVVVDDEPAIADVVSRLMRREGHQVVAFLDAHQALADLERAQPDVILCDLMMPHLTGAELYAEVTRRAPSLAARFVFMSGGATRDELHAFLDQGGHECIEKPFSLALLREALQRAFVRAKSP